PTLFRSRFSTMNCWCSDSPSFAAKMRARGSTEPPGGYGDTNFTTLVGHSWAASGPAMMQSANARNTHRPSFVFRPPDKGGGASFVKCGRGVLERHIASSLELQHVARLVGRRHREAELLEDAPRLRHLLGVRFRELAAPEPEAIFQADAHVAAHDRAHRGDEHLVAPGVKH